MNESSGPPTKPARAPYSVPNSTATIAAATPTSIVTLLGLSLPTLVAGAIFIEVVFNYPGMGLAFYNAALNVDYQVLLGFTVLATVATILGNLLADIGYAILDPRVRYS